MRDSTSQNKMVSNFYFLKQFRGTFKKFDKENEKVKFFERA